MKIFTINSHSAPEGTEKTQNRTSEASERPKNPLSKEEEIRANLQKMRQGAKAPKIDRSKKKAQLEEEGVHTRELGDLSNDPTDPATTEKLKSLLKTGAFSFSAKERDVLQQILGE
jgi:hypothetical protein